MPRLGSCRSARFLRLRRTPEQARASSTVGAASGALLFDRHVHEVPPLRPRAVVVLDLLVAQQLAENEPGVGAALADAAVGGYVLAGGDALRLVELLQLLPRPSSRTACAHGIDCAVGMCPARCAPSCS
jgi:hypothetical protein